MSRIEDYRSILKNKSDWESFLLQESRLPGPRANLELVEAVLEEGSQETFLRYIHSPHEFLAMCGVVGLGKLLVAGKIEFFHILRKFACDDRWRIREGVAMALQHLGEKDMELLLDEMFKWSNGNYLEKRAVIAALCEPKLLNNPKQVQKILHILDEITNGLLNEEDRKKEDFKILRKSLGYCWSVVTVAMPEEGKKKMEKWFNSSNKDILWVMKENLKKSRLLKMDSTWVENWKSVLF